MIEQNQVRLKQPNYNIPLLLLLLILCIVYLSGCITTNSNNVMSEEDIVKHLTRQINHLDDGIEHGAVILCNRTCYHTGIVSGNNFSVGLYLPKFKEAGYVVGTIHSHPVIELETEEKTNQLSIVNKRPSQGDWSSAMSFLTEDNRFTIYIIGPDNKVRSYKIR